MAFRTLSSPFRPAATDQGAIGLGAGELPRTSMQGVRTVRQPVRTRRTRISG